MVGLTTVASEIGLGMLLHQEVASVREYSRCIFDQGGNAAEAFHSHAVNAFRMFMCIERKPVAQRPGQNNGGPLCSQAPSRSRHNLSVQGKLPRGTVSAVISGNEPIHPRTRVATFPTHTVRCYNSLPKRQHRVHDKTIFRNKKDHMRTTVYTREKNMLTDGGESPLSPCSGHPDDPAPRPLQNYSPARRKSGTLLRGSCPERHRRNAAVIANGRSLLMRSGGEAPPPPPASTSST